MILTRLTKAIVHRLNPYEVTTTARARDVDDIADLEVGANVVVAEVVAERYVTDSRSGLTVDDLPPIRWTDRAELGRRLTRLEREIPDHKWGDLARMRDVVVHYGLAINVRSGAGDYTIPGR